jgi:hypothetical protein
VRKSILQSQLEESVPLKGLSDVDVTRNQMEVPSDILARRAWKLSKEKDVREWSKDSNMRDLSQLNEHQTQLGEARHDIHELDQGQTREVSETTQTTENMPERQRQRGSRSIQNTKDSGSGKRDPARESAYSWKTLSFRNKS